MGRCVRSCVKLAVMIALPLALAGCDRPGDGASGGSELAAGSEPTIVLAKRMLANGLVIEDLIEGEGEEVAKGATVEVNFRASIEDGEEFDSSEARKLPLVLPLDRPSTIEGLREGVPGMRVGGKRRIAIPWLLAYGEEGRDPIPPRSNLIFEIELLKIVGE